MSEAHDRLMLLFYLIISKFSGRIQGTPKLGSDVIKNFMLNSGEHEFFPAHKC